MARRSKKWYAAWTRSRHEKHVAEQLAECDLDCFLPLVNKTRQWSDRRKNVLWPLFPGYVFVRASAVEFATIVRIKGIVNLVSSDGIPSPVEDREIEDIRSVLNSGLPVETYPSLVIGTRVQIAHGPLKGVCGTLIKRRGWNELVVSVKLIQEGVLVTLPRDAIEALM